MTLNRESTRMGQASDDKLFELRLSLNETSKHVQSAMTVFSIFLCYFVFTVLGTTPAQILTGTTISLPIFSVNLTLLLFYYVAPFIVFFMHLYIVLQVCQTIHLAVGFHRELYKIPLKEDREHQRKLIFPFLPAMTLLAGTKRPFFRFGVELLTILSIGLTPPIVLLICQMKFLPYHSHTVTTIHQVLVVLDLALVGACGIWAFIKAGSLSQKDLGLRSWTRIFDIVSAAYTLVFVLATAYFSWFMENIPDVNSSDSQRNFADTLFPRNIQLPDHFSLTDAAKSGGLKVDFTDRDLVGLTARNADFSGATFSNTDLREAILYRTNFSGADLEIVDLRGAGLMEARLNGATLSVVNATGAFLQGAEFIGSVILSSNFEFVSFKDAKISDSYLAWSRFQGADFENAQLSGIVAHVNFDATSFRRATVTGLLPGFQAIPPGQKRIKAPIAWNEKMGDRPASSFVAADFDGASIGKVDLRSFDLRSIEGNVVPLTASTVADTLKVARDDLIDVPEGAREGAKLRLDFVSQARSDLGDEVLLPTHAKVSTDSTDAAAAILLQTACRDVWFGRGFLRSVGQIPLDDRRKHLVEQAEHQDCIGLKSQRDAITSVLKQDQVYVGSHPKAESNAAPQSSVSSSMVR